MTPFRPLLNRMRRAAGAAPDFWALADEVWEVAPGGPRAFPAAVFLPGQLERIRATVFDDLEGTRRAFASDAVIEAAPTLAARFRDVDLVDGVLYKGGAEMHLRARRNRLPLAPRPVRSVSGAIYDSWVGLRYFGNWLMDDCETYRLAEAFGPPVTLRADSAGHCAEYERRLDIRPLRVEAAHFDELVLFRDLANNAGKMARAADRRERLLAGREVRPHPGVFLLRGETGDRRLMRNEAALAEALERRHGIRPVAPQAHGVEELIAACAGARLVVGVEGSQLTHGLAVAEPGSAVLALLPPDRATAAMKLMTDRLDMRFALVVGEGDVENFAVAGDEVEATLDLLG